ncbi:hypothetical protein [Natrinema versiforme]|uniref:Uncharacterized protein n=1 Tax=Natrinema versiforme TaxID=88724 RepID=A0A4P8WK47_9EURY|nr:hypothetical protein [Natrinema versiforme]QCS43887.1 hypothetical protein FEJ81_16605 [Natrinema versiforme]
MIASPPFSDNISRIHFDDLEASELVELLDKSEYKRGDAYGFSLEESEPSLISAHLMLTSPEIRQVFDEDTQSVEEQQIDTVEMIPFRIDTKYSLLEIFSSKDSVSTVTNKLGQLTNWDITIENAALDLLSVRDSISEEYRTEIQSMKISNYSVSDSAIGSCRLKMNGPGAGEQLVEEYNEDITYLGLEVRSQSDTVTLGLYESGSIQVYNNMDGLSGLVDTIKQSMVEETPMVKDA